MPRARNKQQLLEFGKVEFSTLKEYVNGFSKQELTQKEVFANRTVKDIIVHLVAWHGLFLTWYVEGMAGNAPAIPAEGYSFKDTPQLNEKLYQEYRNVSWNVVWKKFKITHAELMTLIEKHTDAELTEKKKYAWTGSTNLASYFASATSSHYQWANGLLKKFKKEL